MAHQEIQTPRWAQIPPSVSLPAKVIPGRTASVQKAPRKPGNLSLVERSSTNRPATMAAKLDGYKERTARRLPTVTDFSRVVKESPLR